MMRARERDALLLSLKDAVDDLQPEGTIRTEGPDGKVVYTHPDNNKHAFVSGSVVGTVPTQQVVGEESEVWGPIEMTPLNKRAEVLRRAEDLINGDRAQVYGPIEISFQRHADIWNAMGYRLMVPVEAEGG